MELKKELVFNTEQEKENLDVFLNKKIDTLVHWKNQPIVKLAFDNQRLLNMYKSGLDRLFESVVKKEPFIHNILLISGKKLIYKTEPCDLKMEECDENMVPKWLLNHIASSQIISSFEVFAKDSTNKKSLVAIKQEVSINEHTNEKNYILLVVDKNKMFQELHKRRSTPIEKLLFCGVSNSGDLFLPTSVEEENKNIYGFINEFKSKRSGIFEYKEILINIQKSKNYPFIIYGAVDTSKVFEPVNEFIETGVALVAVILIIGIVFAYILALKITDSLELLTEIVKSYSKDKSDKNVLQKLIPLQKKKNEIGLFSKEFYNLISKINTYTDDLENKVAQEVEKNLQKDRLIHQHAKSVALGELLENIAHQWRQPLSVISTAASGLELHKEFNTLDDEKFNNLTSLINETSKNLSNTIEDFTNFYKPDNEIKDFRIIVCIKNSLKLLEAKIIEKNIRTVIDCDDITLSSYENNMIQILINIFNNSIEALENVDMHKRFIFIELKQVDADVLLKIKDTAGGIIEENIHRVFEPYFTTKHKSQGVGIGLYMTQEITTKHLQGTIEISNETFTYQNTSYKGALLTVKLPNTIKI
ncbi:HAMP domain-containing histidine kinase [Arcobacteraceae bacterium]|nr:HAMP domain-containing histidine kinase [Arcobacteraceae bacterium]